MAEKRTPKGRPRLGGSRRYKQQHKLHAETVDKNLAVLAMLASTNNIQATIQHFYPSLSTHACGSKCTQIYGWRRARQKLAAASEARKGAQREVREIGTATVVSHEQEEEIIIFVNGLRKQGMSVSTTILTIRAKEVAVEAEINAFQASASWVSGFKRRHQMSIYAATRQRQTSLEDLMSIAAAFAVQVQEVIQHHGVKRVYNADQTGYCSSLNSLLYIFTNAKEMC